MEIKQRDEEGQVVKFSTHCGICSSKANSTVSDGGSDG